MDPKPPITLASTEELAHFLDTNCNSWNITHFDRDLIAELKAAQFPTELGNYIGIEQIVLGFWFDECTAKREWSATTNTGEEVGSPLPSELQPAAFDYFVQRFEQSTNPYLKARYGLLLWNAPKPYKNQRYLKGALDHLLIAIDQVDCTGKENRRNCIDLLDQACAVAITAKYRQEDTVAAVLDRFTNTIPFEREGRNDLFYLINEHPKLFRSKTADILAVARDLFEENYLLEDFSACRHIANRAAPFAQGSNLSVQEWHFRSGRAYEGHAQQRLTDDSSFISIKFYATAAQAYQLAGDEAAEQQALQKAQDLKDKIRLGTVRQELPGDDAQKLGEAIKQHIERILGLDSASIFIYLATSEEVIPDYVRILQQASQSGFSISDIVSVTSIDINKNFQQTTSDTIDGVPTEKLRMLYNTSLHFGLNRLLLLFLDGCRAGKLTFPALRDFLDQSSWIAQPLTKIDFDGNEIVYTWQPMLYPALEEFFKQLQITIQEDSPEQPSFVLCLDSLTLKIEGLMREVLQQFGAATLTTNKKSDLREVFFDDLLEMAKKNDLLNESEAFFFRFVFTPLSQNIRNNIAHSYFHLPGHYTLDRAILVFCALLRLINFKYTEKPAPE